MLKDKTIDIEMRAIMMALTLDVKMTSLKGWKILFKGVYLWLRMWVTCTVGIATDKELMLLEKLVMIWTFAVLPNTVFIPLNVAYRKIRKEVVTKLRAT